jgi:thiamine pyrophosphokinase
MKKEELTIVQGVEIMFTLKRCLIHQEKLTCFRISIFTHSNVALPVETCHLQLTVFNLRYHLSNDNLSVYDKRVRGTLKKSERDELAPAK